MIGWSRLDRAPLEAVIEASPELPVLLAHGVLDEVIPVGNSRVMSEITENAWFAPFAGGGHAFMAQEPQRLSGLIDTFLGR